MTTSYVHVEVSELRERTFYGLEADVRVFHPAGPPVSLLIRATGDQQPFWRVASVEPLASPEVMEALDASIAREELWSRISTALTLANLWDSAKASSDRLREIDQGLDD